MKSTVSCAKKGTNSLRTTIPEGICEYLGLKEGDKIDWQFVSGISPTSNRYAIIVPPKRSFAQSP